MILQFCQLMYNVWRRVGLGGCTLYAVFYIRGYTLYFKYVYTIHYTLYIIHYTWYIMYPQWWCSLYTLQTHNKKCYEILCCLYFVFCISKNDVSLQSIWAKQQRISSFSSSKKQKRKNKDGVTDVFLQSIWAKQQRISSLERNFKTLSSHFLS